MKPQPRKAGPYVSEYLRIKAQIEELQAQLEKTRIAELEVEIVDIKKRILAFGILPTQLYSAEDLKPHRPSRVRTANPRPRSPPKYAFGGYTWSGNGNRPRWFVKAIKEQGQTEASMLIQKS